MTRRTFTTLWVLAPALARAEAKAAAVRGRLVQDPDRPPAIRTAGGRVITLEGDEATVAVLRDKRLAQDDFEAVGEFVAPDRFRVDPIYKRALFVYRHGKRLVITYWCDVCAIRTYSPGKCQCCQNETALDPRDPALENTDAERTN